MDEISGQVSADQQIAGAAATGRWQIFRHRGTAAAR
jgi:hypothetical protein